MTYSQRCLRITFTCLLTAATVLSVPAMAADADVSAGDWILRGGMANIEPKSDNGTLDNGLEVDVDSKMMPTFTVTRMLTDDIGLELLGSAPFEHDISLAGAGKVGSTQHLAPTLSLQYHFNNRSAVRPYVGAGLNHTIFFNEDETAGGALAGSELDLDSSTGLGVQAGVDYAIDSRWVANLSIRWFDIDTDVEVNGADVGEAEVDPWFFGVGIGYRI